MKVPMVATRLHGRAMTWQQQSKLSRYRLEKQNITSLEKMKKHLCSTFLPYNYMRLMYHRLQNLRQGMRSVEDYTTEFYLLLVRNEIQESENQLVAQYISGLRVQIQETVNLFDLIFVLVAHQRALQVEKQLSWRFGSGLPINTGNNIEGANRSTSGNSWVSVLPLIWRKQAGPLTVE